MCPLEGGAVLYKKKALMIDCEHLKASEKIVIKQDSNEEEEKFNEITCLKSIYWSVSPYNAFLIQVTDAEKKLSV